MRVRPMFVFVGLTRASGPCGAVSRIGISTAEQFELHVPITPITEGSAAYSFALAAHLLRSPLCPCGFESSHAWKPTENLPALNACRARTKRIAASIRTVVALNRNACTGRSDAINTCGASRPETTGEQTDCGKGAIAVPPAAATAAARDSDATATTTRPIRTRATIDRRRSPRNRGSVDADPDCSIADGDAVRGSADMDRPYDRAESVGAVRRDPRDRAVRRRHPDRP